MPLNGNPSSDATDLSTVPKPVSPLRHPSVVGVMRQPAPTLCNVPSGLPSNSPRIMTLPRLMIATIKPVQEQPIAGPVLLIIRHAGPINVRRNP